MSRGLVALDNEPSPAPVAEMAARAFKAVYRRLGEGDFDARYERDIRSAAAELAEIGGWALFNAKRFGAARRFNAEALSLAVLSGDRSIELLIMQNMGMLAGWSGRGGEELAIARAVVERGRLSPRIEAMFRAREAQGLAAAGRGAEAARSFDRARSLLQDAAPDSAPAWAWWITGTEIDRQQGRVLHESGELRAAIPVLQRATRRTETPVGYHNIAAVRLLACLIQVRAWRDAEEEAVALARVVAETTSAVTLDLLAAVARRGEALRDAPGALRDALHQVRTAVTDDPFALGAAV
ncbi:hypothetical protein [Streptomyces sp. SBT349]|uniref:hypothetical protein n=1 Tax=Streptomyces sp. SBT349 TaxID=1580539 RepID=UPI00066DB942|nr:hypothetical protein [Streptomyces sp. SBT349]